MKSLVQNLKDAYDRGKDTMQDTKNTFHGSLKCSKICAHGLELCLFVIAPAYITHVCMHV